MNLHIRLKKLESTTNTVKNKKPRCDLSALTIEELRLLRRVYTEGLSKDLPEIQEVLKKVKWL